MNDRQQEPDGRSIIQFVASLIMTALRRLWRLVENWQAMVLVAMLITGGGLWGAGFRLPAFANQPVSDATNVADTPTPEPDAIYLVLKADGTWSWASIPQAPCITGHRLPAGFGYLSAVYKPTLAGREAEAWHFQIQARLPSFALVPDGSYIAVLRFRRYGQLPRERQYQAQIKDGVLTVPHFGEVERSQVLADLRWANKLTVVMDVDGQLVTSDELDLTGSTKALNRAVETCRAVLRWRQ